MLQKNQNVNNYQSEGGILSTQNDDSSTSNNGNEIGSYVANNNFDSNNADVMTNQNNNVTADGNKESSDANQISLPLSFDPTFAGVESEKEDDEAHISPSDGSTKK